MIAKTIVQVHKNPEYLEMFYSRHLEFLIVQTNILTVPCQVLSRSLEDASKVIDLSENRNRPICCSCKTGNSIIHDGHSEDLTCVDFLPCSILLENSIV